MKFYSALIAFFLILFTGISSVQAEEKYADVVISDVTNWNVGQMQTFSGTVPSRAWVFEKEDAEVFVSVLVTEGVQNGLNDQKPEKLAKLYMESFVSGWGGRLNGSDKGMIAAAFCGGEPGYKGEATFGETKYDYYGCLKMNATRSRSVAIVTWVAPGTPEQVAAMRLMTYVEAVQIKK